MMKRRIPALALAALMVMSTVAVATGTEKTISVTPMTLTINGQAVTPTKSDGTPAEVFAYEGATYAPLRYLGELNGNQVTWDKNDPNTAKITTGITYADTIVWDGEYDVVVVGFGGAGAVAARNAADAGASVLLVDKAPEGHEGGNTRYCGQFILNVDSSDEETAMGYFKGLYSDFKIDETVLKTYVHGITQTLNVLVNEYGVEEGNLKNWKGVPRIGDFFVPEYPWIDGGETINLYTITEVSSNAAIWNKLRESVIDRSDRIDVWYEAPGQHLIQDPVSKTIIGVQIDKQGTPVNIRATNGVVLTTGGFENNQEMVQDYLGLTNYAVAGSLYNTGDGIKMASEVGADLWHMETYEGNGFMFAGSSYPVEAGARADGCQNYNLFGSGSIVLVGDDGVRYLREDAGSRHGHVEFNGDWIMPTRPNHSYVIYDQVKADAIAAANGIPEKYLDKVVSADTITALAEKLGMSKLEQTIQNFNSFAASGNDPQFERAAASMTAFSSSGPYYAFEFLPSILNTQGGPRRNEQAQILDISGNPIPHLYSAGELGGVIAYQYNGGGNLAECLTFGKIAGINAAAEKAALPPLPGKATSNLVYTIDSNYERNPGSNNEISLGENQYLGIGSGGMGGNVKVIVTMDGSKISKVEVVEHKETEGIGTKAIDTLPTSIVSAQSVDVDNVSGATLTSKAIKEAVADALSQVK